jgi:hypothetical protein
MSTERRRIVGLALKMINVIVCLAQPEAASKGIFKT